jgi:hypothetical protein
MVNLESPRFMKLLAAALMLAVAFATLGDVSPAIAKDKPTAAKSNSAKSDGKGAEDKKGKKGDKPDAAACRALGTYGDNWSSHACNGKGKTCYALGSPKERMPKVKLKDTQAFIFVTTRPGEGVHEEVAIDLGYPAKDNGAATADVDGDSYDLITKGNNAWVKNAAKEREFVEALKGGAKLIVKASPARGASTTDTYSLKGLSDALTRVGQECK